MLTQLYRGGPEVSERLSTLTKAMLKNPVLPNPCCLDKGEPDCSSPTDPGSYSPLCQLSAVGFPVGSSATLCLRSCAVQDTVRANVLFCCDNYYNEGKTPGQRLQKTCINTATLVLVCFSFLFLPLLPPSLHASLPPSPFLLPSFLSYVF